MMMQQPISEAIRDKIAEQTERVEHLIGLIPTGSLSWAPVMDRTWTTGKLLTHLIGCLAGFCAVLFAAEPMRLGHLLSIRELEHVPENNLPLICERIRLFSREIAAGFDVIEDATLSRRIPTVFVPEGQSIMTLLLGNLEHLINHKHQLFVHLRLMGVAAESCDLYRFRS